MVLFGWNTGKVLGLDDISESLYLLSPLVNHDTETSSANCQTKYKRLSAVLIILKCFFLLRLAVTKNLVRAESGDIHFVNK